MAHIIQNIIPFPNGAQSSPFFGALASTLLPALGYSDDTPYFCGPKNSYCIGCSDCGSTLKKHHNLIYHDYQTFTGVSLGWVWPEEGKEYQTMPGWQEGWRWPDEFFGYIFGYAGLSWNRIGKQSGQAVVFAEIKASIDAGQPALMKLGDGPDWHVATGYDDDGKLYGLDSRKHFDHTLRPTVAAVTQQHYTEEGLFILRDWFSFFEDAIIIAGRVPPAIMFRDVLSRLITTLEHPAHTLLERDLMARLDAVSPYNAWETAQWLLAKVGFPIEARWHAADSSLIRLTEDKNAQKKIFGMIRQYVFDNELETTHGTCWKIWAQLGVCKETGYALPPNAGKLLTKRETQTELKRLFAVVFANDRVVLELLREANK